MKPLRNPEAERMGLFGFDETIRSDLLRYRHRFKIKVPDYDFAVVFQISGKVTYKALARVRKDLKRNYK